MNIKMMKNMLSALCVLYILIIMTNTITCFFDNYLLRTVLTIFSLLVVTIVCPLDMIIDYMEEKQISSGLCKLYAVSFVSLVLQLFFNVFLFASKNINLKKVIPIAFAMGIKHLIHYLNTKCILNVDLF